MAARCTYITLCCILLLNTCILKTFGEEGESGKDEGKSEEIKTLEETVKGTEKEFKNGIAPGEVVLSPGGKLTTEGVTPSSDDKKVEIKQSENGKTTEELKAAEDDKKQAEKGKSTEEKKEDGKKTEEWEKKEDEKKEDEKKEDEKKEDEKKEDEKKEDEKKEGEEKKVEEPGIELKVLSDNDFEHLTQASSGATTGDWLILFSKDEDCEQCTQVEKELRLVYERLKHKLNVAKVKKGSSSKLTFRRFSIEDLPGIFLFYHGKKYSFNGEKTVEGLINFVEGGYQTMSWSVVKEPYTFFDLLIDESVEELKHMLRYKKNVSLIIFIAGFVVGISVTSICGSILFHLLENFKDDDDDEQVKAVHRELAKNKAE